MIFCEQCGRYVCKPCNPKPLNDNKRTVVVASDDELLRRSHFQRLATTTRSLGMSRREIPNWIADTIYGFRGKITWPGGKPFEVDDEDIDAAFNDDGSFRWLSGFMYFDDVDPKQAPQRRILTRLRLIDLAFRISNPVRAGFIAK